MAHHEHNYSVSVHWIGNKGKGTAGYQAYSREHRIEAEGKPALFGSSDPAFLGNKECWNPEELLVASVSACHKLWYLHLCADAGIVVLAYQDKAEGTMIGGDKGHFTQIILHPHSVIRAGDDIDLAKNLHHQAHEQCFIANSLNFPVLCWPVIETEKPVL